jgi:hypothetical protein
MAKRSSRKSSSGDEALLWGIAAVVVAVVGVGTAIMLTRRGKSCKHVQCTSDQVKKMDVNSWKTSESECCKSSNPSKPVSPSKPSNPSKPVSPSKPSKPSKPVSPAKPAKPVAKTGCLPDPTYTKIGCEDVDCSQTTLEETCPGPCCVWVPPPPCKVQRGNGTCLSKVNSQGKRNCVGGDQLCGVNLKVHNAANQTKETCEEVFKKYNKQMINCDNGYTAYVEPVQDYCVFKCRDDTQGKCCGDGCDKYPDEYTCTGKENVSNPQCYWDETGQCVDGKKENFRMRRRRR